MRKVVFCTFSRNHGMHPGVFRHGFIDLEYFRHLTVIPTSTVYVDVYQRSLRLHYDDGTSEDKELDFWGFSRNLFDMCRSLSELEFPFQCHCVVNSVVGEYEE